MMRIKLITIGDIKETYLKSAIDEYKKRLSKFCELSIIELKENIAKSSSEQDVLIALKKDAENIKKYLKGYIIVLDIKGKQITSDEFAKKIQEISLKSADISFVIGASNGIDEEIKNLANFKLSFSPMTFPHQLMRVIFLEQLYRAFTILNNIKYHK